MHYKDLQELAKIRLREAKTLFKKREYSGAYYFSGYVIECGLKAVIAKNVKAKRLPERKLANNIYNKGHDLRTLIDLAGLKPEYDDNIKQSTVLSANLKIVEEWSVESRYAKWQKGDAKDILEAVDDSTNGVFVWVMKHW